MTHSLEETARRILAGQHLTEGKYQAMWGKKEVIGRKVRLVKGKKPDDGSQIINIKTNKTIATFYFDYDINIMQGGAFVVSLAKGRDDNIYSDIDEIMKKFDK